MPSGVDDTEQGPHPGRQQLSTPDDGPAAGPPQMQVQGALARITLNRPAQANRLEPGDLAVLRQHVLAASADPDVLVLCLQSGGRHFCGGYDIGRLAPARTTAFEDMVNTIEEARPVTLALLHGGVYGGAIDMALACDFRIGQPGIEMFMPAARLGLHFYARGMQRFVSRLGVDNAKRLFLSAERMDAAEMKAIGFLTHLTPAAQMQAVADALIAALSGMAPLALLGMKKHLNRLANGTPDFDALQRDILRTAQSADLQEGLSAWTEKRAPRFKGQ